MLCELRGCAGFGRLATVASWQQQEWNWNTAVSKTEVSQRHKDGLGLPSAKFWAWKVGTTNDDWRGLSLPPSRLI